LSTIRVFLADDHEVVRAGARNLLRAAGLEVVGEAANYSELFERLASSRPDVVLLDLLMPGGSPSSAIRQLRRTHPQVPVVALTSVARPAEILRARRAGAPSYQIKDVAPQELLRTVRLAAEGEPVLHPRAAACLLENLQNAPRLPFDPLSDRELQVLQAIAGGQDNREIAQSLEISAKTVKSHVSNILSKLRVRDRTQAAILAWKEGLVD